MRVQPSYDEIAEAMGKVLVFFDDMETYFLIGRFETYRDAYDFCMMNGYDYMDLDFLFLQVLNQRKQVYCFRY